jgi:hypothetical protein
MRRDRAVRAPGDLLSGGFDVFSYAAWRDYLLVHVNPPSERNDQVSKCHDRGETRVRWRRREDGLEESVQFVPGYNCPVTGGQGHGVHGTEVRWFLRGPAGAVSLVMATDWIPGERYPGHGLAPSGQNEHWDMYPMAFGLGYHARMPQYEGQEVDLDDCNLIGGGPCYGGADLSGPDEAVRRFVTEGEQAVWDALEAAYASIITARERSA